jgi:hypothetical protein
MPVPSFAVVCCRVVSRVSRIPIITRSLFRSTDSVAHATDISRLRITCYHALRCGPHAGIAVEFAAGISPAAEEEKREDAAKKKRKERNSVSRLFTRHPLHHLLFIINLTLPSPAS